MRTPRARNWCSMDTIKIDRSFVAGLVNDDANLPIVQAVISLAHGLGIEVTAEGIETVEQLELVRRAGCTEMQGYLVSAPRPPCELPEMIARYRGEEAAA